MVKFASVAFLAFAALASAAPITPSPSVKVDPVTPSPSVKIDSATADSDNIFATDVKYTGKATWFTDSYGSCNIEWNGDSEPTVALNAHQMGAVSWGNPACNKRVLIVNQANGKSVEARIVDKCPGDECAWGSLDLSPAAFKQLGSLDTGILPIEWHYI
ncbi:RlpA-like double-psi beta-barrel-protein domain-containing protein-containing protein [Gamsiella multidivaricata]|uniref:RlpA-like double-psi beta-barrel-protein domain-containing protein-containing protein n=1 Tax=Gamsiella multidivaricata TaxID=101098 RepID=UPI00221EE55A|nr:RlpA-like double-psi beta-barrel-protein domain-containing protein-containing protein [Gamsiella multidivaricata]KAG0366187.1 hypothetical protein BGZ54_005688 [Gamsiella multidivaricata]KAI7831511.1 RlpA-like double-psi beta-barrel-protein domain-containing protein-containing protein [Gamsiella multidivaricata]